MSTSTTVTKPGVTFSSVDFWMLFLVTVWGVNFVLLKRAVGEMSALGFNGLRFGLGTLLMLLIWRMSEERQHIRRRDWPRIIMLGIIGNTFYQLFFILAIKFSTASNTSLIVATSPIWIALLSWILGLGRLGWKAWLGIFVSFFGLFLIINASGQGIALGSETLFGDLLMLGGALSWSLYSVLSKPLLTRYSSTTFTTWTMAAGAPLVLIPALPDLLQTNYAALSGMTWLTLFFSSAFAISIGYIIWNMGIHRLGQTRTATYSNVTPVVAFALGALFLGEPVTALKIVGAVVVLFGVSLTRRG